MEREFERVVARTVEWVRANLTVVGLSAAAAAVVIVALVVSLGGRESREAGVVKDLEAAVITGAAKLEDLRDAVDRAEGTISHARALLACGNAFFDAGRFPEAREMYEELVDTQGDTILAWWGRLALGVTLEELAQRDSARDVYQSIVGDLEGTFFAQRAADRLAALAETPASRPTQRAEETESGT